MTLDQCIIGARVAVSGTSTRESPPMVGLIAGLPVEVYSREGRPRESDPYIPVLLDDPALIQGRELTFSVVLFSPEDLKPGGNYE